MIGCGRTARYRRITGSLWTATVLIAAIPEILAAAAVDPVIQVTASAQKSPPQIKLSWPGIAGSSGITVYRKAKNATSWGAAYTNLAASATNCTDTNVSVGVAYEYEIYSLQNEEPAYGYVCAGIEIPLVDSRGKVILLVDETMANPLEDAIGRLELDLVGDGWTVLRHDVARQASTAQAATSNEVVAIKAIISAEYLADTNNVKAVLLLGRVACPYSGNIAPDGHSEHTGAWPADIYYTQVGATWPDTQSLSSNGRNANQPGDGKFDNSTYDPSLVKFAVGRIDMSDMPAFGVSETALLLRYLDKNHSFRNREVVYQPRCVVDDNFAVWQTEYFGQNGWRIASLVGPANTFAGDFFGDTVSIPTLWAYGAGGGWYQGADGVGSTAQFASQSPQAVFTMLFGSYFGDYDSSDNFMRACLASGGAGLTCLWGGRPNWFWHHMGLGEPVGASVRICLANPYLYPPSGYGANMVHRGLLGDPTLRMHILAPPADLEIYDSTLSWAASADAGTPGFKGYHVYRSPSQAGPFARLTADIEPGLSWVDPSPAGGAVYQVRAVRLETSVSGTYYNNSQGIFVATPPTNLTIVNGPAPSGIYAGPEQAEVTASLYTNGGSQAVGYLFYGTSNPGTNRVWSFTNELGVLASRSTVTQALINLAPNTVYYFMAYATNAWGEMSWGGSTGVQFRTSIQGQVATGGFVTNYQENSTNFIAHIFADSGSFAVYKDHKADVLVVGGGGGGGGRHSGGGGAGGLIYTTALAIVAGSNYTVTVGPGGAGYPVGGAANPGSRGSNSVFGSVIAYGGGYGNGGAGGDGGSGGGGGPVNASGGSCTNGQGYRGGSGAGEYAGGGGGGAGGQGVDGNGVYGDAKDGGPGISNRITGVWTLYAGGGGGGIFNNGWGYQGIRGFGGSGIGGDGGQGGNPAATAGKAGTGSGGGGGGGENGGGGGNGGSGIVVVRYVVKTISLVASNSSVNVTEGSTTNFAVRLSEQPTGSVAVTIARTSGCTNVVVQSGDSLAFTTNNWHIYQTVTLAAARNPGTTNGIAMVTCSATGIAEASVTVALIAIPPPSCEITDPVSGTIVKAGTNVTITAAASVSYGAVSNVEFYCGGVKIGEDMSSPYTCLWMNVSIGSYELTARATDNDGVTGPVSPAVNIAVTVDGLREDVLAAGGTVTNYTLNNTNFTAHIFTAVGMTGLTVVVGGPVEVLVVAGGGGGGGGHAGAGGAGGLIYTSSFELVSGSNYTVMVGAGGMGANYGDDPGRTGSNSVFGILTAHGGGGGYGGQSVAGGPGGSGAGGGPGGGSGGASTAVAPELGHRGGSGGYAQIGGSWIPWSAGGGGGAGGPGVDGAGTNMNGSAGGPGVSNNMSGASAWYAGGGGGGTYGGVRGSGGIGGGGDGGDGTLSAKDANVNTGGGGGGGGNYGKGGNGGSGIVIVRYVRNLPSTVSLTIEAGPGGTVFPAGSIDVERGVDTAIEAIAGTGCIFTNWTVPAGSAVFANSNSASTKVVITAPATIRAKFAVSDMAGDYDHDGMLNGDELSAGTDPFNPTSRLDFTSCAVDPKISDKFLVGWQSATGRRYTVQASADFASGFTNILGTNILATPPLNVYTDNVGEIGRRFYRIKLE